jgi:serine/threonine protein kinase
VTTTPFPAEISERLGVVTRAEHVLSRRGAITWRVVLADGESLAVKLTTDPRNGAAAPRAIRWLALREALVLKELDTISGGLYRADGLLRDSAWVATRWLDGPDLTTLGAMVRAGDQSARDAFLQLIEGSLRRIAALHQCGWRHGDIQADHVLFDTDQARLIDFAYAQGPLDPLSAIDIPYRGGVAHLAAPETAEQLLATEDSVGVGLSRAAEMYTFGAAIRSAWTGSWPRLYGGRDPRSLDVRSIWRIVAEEPPSPWDDVRTSPWSRLERLIDALMSPTPEERPTADELVGETWM